MSKQRLATIWLDGCSGCHMSLLDTDERLIEVAKLFDIVYSPLVDVKEFPKDVDVTLVEGAISSEGDHDMILKIRANTKTLVAFGDCAVTGNVPSMRNHFHVDDVLARGYIETANNKANRIPKKHIPLLREKAIPVYDIVTVDVFLQGCPPSADLIFYTLSELAERRTPDLSEKARFG